MGGALSVVETARLVGRLPALEHLDEFAALMAQPDVGRWLAGTRTREQCEAWIRKDMAHWATHDFGVWHAFERSTDQLVGRIGARMTIVAGSAEAELAWAVHPDHWGQGYALELARPARDLAFSRGLNSVVAFTMPDNTASRRVMEKLDMTYEADITYADLPHVLYRLRRA